TFGQRRRSPLVQTKPAPPRREGCGPKWVESFRPGIVGGNEGDGSVSIDLLVESFFRARSILPDLFPGRNGTRQDLWRIGLDAAGVFCSSGRSYFALGLFQILRLRQ